MNESRSAFQRHPRMTLTGIVVVGLLCVLMLVEVAARLLLPEWAPITGERVAYWRYDPTLGWAHEAGQYGRLTHPDFDIDVRINSHGQRDDEYPLERTSRHRMLVLGDSFAWGFGVEHRERFDEIIERRHPGWEVINAAVSGYGTDQALLYLRERGLAFRPDVVLLLFHENDFENNARAVEYWYPKPYFVLRDAGLELRNTPVPKSTFKQRCNRFFYGRTYVLGRIYAAVGALTREARRPFWSRGGSATDEGGEVTAALVSAMNQACAAASARLLVVSVPGSEGLPARLRSMTGPIGVPYLALDDAFAGLEATFEHDGHWTSEGHAIAAEAIETFLEEIGVFERVATNSN
jgi:hypothetical protein